MQHQLSRGLYRPAVIVVAATAALVPTLISTAQANEHGDHGGEQGAFVPGDLLVSRSVYLANSGAIATLALGAVLPPACVASTLYGITCSAATTGGTFPTVFNNASADGSFGVTSPIFLDEISQAGTVKRTIEVPNSTTPGATSTSDQMVTSLSSKSELALNLSGDGRSITFMGYAAPVGAIDVSNSNTPGSVDPTNPVSASYYRVVAQLDTNGKFHFTETNAYSGNNGRAVVAETVDGHQLYYTVGNAGNGGNPQPQAIVAGAGSQLMKASNLPESAQSPGAPTPVSSFSITELPTNSTADKIGKDDNFRGLAIYNNVVYMTKGSGSNGIDTVYFIDTSGSACPAGVGVPVPGAPLPTATVEYYAQMGLSNNMCVLKGLPTTLAKPGTSPYFPFGLWFANPTTLYVADEGNGANTGYSSGTGSYATAAGSSTAGLEKWSFNSGTGTWVLDYTIQNGLHLGASYVVPGYPTGLNAATGLPWAPANDGLRNLTGQVNPNGTASIWAVTSTVSGSGDQGADPNSVVTVTDPLSATTLPSSDAFSAIEAPTNVQVYRGISFAPHDAGGY